MFGIPTILSTLVLAALPTSSETTLLFFTTPGCGPCRQIAPLVQELGQQGYPVQMIDAAQQPEIVQRLGVDRFPTFLMLSKGEIVDRVVGGGDPVVMKSRILRMFESAAEHQRKISLQQAPPSSVAAVVPAISSAASQSALVVPAFTPVMSSSEPTPTIVPASFTQSAASFEVPRASSSNESDPSWIASSVKLRVDDERGHSWGTGTIIDTRNGEALVLTCGHIFRESQGKGKTEVHLFNKNSNVRVFGQCLYFDLDLDLALVVVTPPCPVRAIPVAPASYQVRSGQQVLSVGCDGGADPTLRNHQILSTDRIGTPSDVPTPFHYIQISGAPVGGRSGGGLFGEEGYLLGVCNTADPVANDGHFVPPHIIRHFLKQKNLSAVYESPSLVDSNPISRSDDPATPNATSLQPLQPLREPSMQSEPSPHREEINNIEQATIDEIKRRTQDGDEVILIVRSRRNPEIPSDVIVLNGVSDQFIDSLAKRPQSNAGYNPIILSSAVPSPTPGSVPVTYPVQHR